MEMAARFGHHLGSFSLESGASGPGRGAQVIQRQILKPDGQPYSRLDNRVKWFRELSDSEREAILKLHEDSKPYTPDDARNAVKTGPPPSTTPPPTVDSGETLNFSDPDSSEESDVDEGNRRFVKKSQKILEGGLSFYDDSSDSDDALGPSPDTETLERRRTMKARELEAMAMTAFPVSDEDKKKFNKLQETRKKAFEERRKKRGKYGEDAQRALMERGREMRKTSLAHNRYGRRGFRNAVTEDKMRTGGSKNYNQKQSDIRKKMHEAMRKDHAKMKWKREDFSSDRAWKSVEEAIERPISNDKKKRRLHEAIDSGADTSNTSNLAAFHHIAWKESMKPIGKPFEEHALNPLNLTLRHDERERTNDPSITPGSHEYDHQATGFKTTDDWAKERSQGGGHFVDLDAEATYYTLKGIGSERQSKTEAYHPKKKKQKLGPTT